MTEFDADEFIELVQTELEAIRTIRENTAPDLRLACEKLEAMFRALIAMAEAGLADTPDGRVEMADRMGAIQERMTEIVTQVCSRASARDT